MSLDAIDIKMDKVHCVLWLIQILATVNVTGTFLYFLSVITFLHKKNTKHIEKIKKTFVYKYKIGVLIATHFYRKLFDSLKFRNNKEISYHDFMNGISIQILWNVV